jgi:hypothetical protein
MHMTKNAAQPHVALAAVLLAATAGAQSWTQVPSLLSPPPRNSTAMAADPLTGAITLFGGYDASPTGLGDTWRFDGASWIQAFPANAPAARWGHGMVFDRARRKFVLFGGYGPSAGIFADTWEFDGASWTQRTTPVAPLMRVYHGMVYDPFLARTIVYGGRGPVPQFWSDTWAWDGSVWTQLAAQGPQARSGHAMAFDEQRREVTLFGGFDGAKTLADTWVLSGATWTQKSGNGPQARHAAAACYDPVRGTVRVHGGANANFTSDFADAWEWDGRQWMQAPAGPSARHGAAMVADSHRSQSLLFGGNSNGAFVQDTWCLPSLDLAMPAREWKSVSTTAIPVRRAPAMAYDAARGRTVMFGGYNLSTPPWTGGGSASYGTRGDGFTWDGVTWAAMTSVPTHRGFSAMTYDSARQRCVLFGGAQGSYPFPLTAIGDTWEYDGTTWTQVASTGPAARQGHGLAYDSANNRAILFGGYVGLNNTTYYADTWAWNGTAWTQLQTQHAPQARIEFAMAYDPSTARVVMHGGRDLNSRFGDTWEFDGADWTEAPGVGPGAMYDHEMAFDSARNRIVLLASGSMETWERQGTTWTRVYQPSPTPAGSFAMAYDSARQRMVMFGGYHTYYPGSPDSTYGAPIATYEEGPQAQNPSGAVDITASVTAYGAPSPYTAFALEPYPSFRPHVGGQLRARVVRQFTSSPEPTVVALGTSATVVSGIPIPIPLDAFGFPSTSLWTSADITDSWPTISYSGGAYLLRANIPADPAFLGVEIFGQAWGLSFSSSGPLSASFAASNALVWRIGNR